MATGNRGRPAAGRPRVYDCFLFFRELDLLEIRLGELDPVVDTFVIVEARRDFAGNEKPLVYKANRSRFAAYAHKIRHIEVLDEPEDAGRRWIRQAHQRRAILEGLGDARPDDLVIVSDVDEIPAARRVARANADPRQNAVHFFNQPLHRFYLDVRDSGGRRWIGSRAVRARHMIDPTRLRKLKPLNYPKAPHAYEALYWGYRSLAEFRALTTRVLHKNAGWHFSSLGDVDYLMAKDAAISFDEQNQVSGAPRAYWESARAGLLMPLGRAERLDVAHDLPRPVRRNPERFAHLLSPRISEAG